MKYQQIYQARRDAMQCSAMEGLSSRCVLPLSVIVLSYEKSSSISSPHRYFSKCTHSIPIQRGISFLLGAPSGEPSPLGEKFNALQVASPQGSLSTRSEGISAKSDPPACGCTLPCEVDVPWSQQRLRDLAGQTKTDEPVDVAVPRTVTVQAACSTAGKSDVAKKDVMLYDYAEPMLKEYEPMLLNECEPVLNHYEPMVKQYQPMLQPCYTMTKPRDRMFTNSCSTMLTKPCGRVMTSQCPIVITKQAKSVNAECHVLYNLNFTTGRETFLDGGICSRAYVEAEKRVKWLEKICHVQRSRLQKWTPKTACRGKYFCNGCRGHGHV